MVAVSTKTGIFWMVTSAWLPGWLPTKAHFSGDHLTAFLTAKLHFAGLVDRPVDGESALRWRARNSGCNSETPLLEQVFPASSFQPGFHGNRGLCWYASSWYASRYARNRGGCAVLVSGVVSANHDVFNELRARFGEQVFGVTPFHATGH